MSLYTDIADAVVTELNVGSFTIPFSAERKWNPDFDETELASIKVTVIPHKRSIKPHTRGDQMQEVSVGVGIAKQIDVNDETTSDAMSDLVDEVVEYLNNRKLPGLPSVRWTGTEAVVIDDWFDIGIYGETLTVLYQTLTT